MRRPQLEHLIGAAATIAADDEIVVVGSQAILGQFPEPPPELTISNEADLFPKNHPERADVVDGSIGELSPFHDMWGYYAQGVGPDTATLPSGWEARLVIVEGPLTRGARGLCLEVHDLVLSKYVANREKDHRFNRAAIAHRLVQRSVLDERLGAMTLDPRVREAVRLAIAADFASAE
ncbi:MAG: hypothetical protein KIT84_30970 [Labilithrix sp.]|nr:hypothetical protein [Labilithrix sp.]MCW5815491.1 hypothetical protein [Labilithrix sp.]